MAQKLGELIDKISIHALREEGDQSPSPALCTPSLFLSTPSARRATVLQRPLEPAVLISIHALREEGDLPLEPAVLQSPLISIHALREEGDGKNRDKISIFL